VSASGPREGEGTVPEDFPWPIVLGVDPGTRVVGYGALVDAPDGPRLLAAGEIRTGSGTVPERLAVLLRDMEGLLERLRPTVVVVEQAFAGRNIQSALRIGEGRGVILACAVRFGAEVVQYAPSSARKSLLGHGGADKTQVARMVAVSLGLDEPPGSLDTTDALALALAYLHRSRFPGPTP
jgi:crossover junction endodeoxyribonuclease RuvC